MTSTDRSGAAAARDDTVAAGSLPQAPSIPPRDLAELAAAIDRLEELIAATAGSQPGGCNAIERIADIAFVLHERDVEASLCDALDAAVRDLGDVGARTRANVERMGEATTLLSDLSRRINGIIARSLAGPQFGGENAAGLRIAAPAPSDEEAAVEAAMNGGSDVRAQAVVTLTESSSPFAGLADEHAADVAIEQRQNGGDTGQVIESGYDVHSRREADQEAGSDAARSAAADQTLADPQDDPGDLFEPPNVPPNAPSNPPIAAPSKVSVPSAPPLPPNPPASALASAEPTTTPADANVADSDQAAPPSSSASPQQPAAATPQPAIGQQTSNDPLAAVRALSEEEMIALFS